MNPLITEVRISRNGIGLLCFMSWLFIFAPILEVYGYEIFPFFFLIPIGLLIYHNHIVASKKSILDLFYLLAITVLMIGNIVLENGAGVTRCLQVIFVLVFTITIQSSSSETLSYINKYAYRFLIFFLVGLIIETLAEGKMDGLLASLRTRSDSTTFESLSLYTGGVRFLSPEPGYASSLVNHLSLYLYWNENNNKRIAKLIFLNLLALTLIRSTTGFIIFLFFMIIRFLRLKYVLRIVAIVALFILGLDYTKSFFVPAERLSIILSMIGDQVRLLDIFSLDEGFGSKRGEAITHMLERFTHIPEDFKLFPELHYFSLTNVIVSTLGAVGTLLITIGFLLSCYVIGFRNSILKLFSFTFSNPILIVPKVPPLLYTKKDKSKFIHYE